MNLFLTKNYERKFGMDKVGINEEPCEGKPQARLQ